MAFRVKVIYKHRHTFPAPIPRFLGKEVISVLALLLEISNISRMKSMYTYGYFTPAWFSYLDQSWTMPCGVITECLFLPAIDFSYPYRRNYITINIVWLPKNVQRWALSCSMLYNKCSD